MIPRFLFQALARAMVRFHVVVLAVAGIVTVVAGVFASKLTIDTSFTATLSEDEPVVEEWAYLSENFPGAFAVQVLIEGPSTDVMIEVAEELEEGFRGSPLVRDVYLEQPVEFFVENGLLFLGEADLGMMEIRLEERGEVLGALTEDPSLLGLMRGLADLTRETLAASESVTTLSTRLAARLRPELEPRISPGVPGLEVGLELDTDPLKKRIDEATTRLLRRVPLPPSEETALRTLESGEAVLSIVADVLDRGVSPTSAEVAVRMDQLREGDYERLGLGGRYRFSEDDSVLLMEVAGANDLSGFEGVAPFVEHLRAVVASSMASHPGVVVRLAGYAPAYEEQTRAITNNFLLVTILGFLGIIAVFVVGFQRVVLPSLSAIPLGVGIIWSMGIQAVVIGQLNILTLVMPVILLGLGIDFAIHILSAYSSERNGGLSPADAFAQVFDRIGPGMVVGAVTTAAAFFALTLASYKGFRDLGFIAGVGVLTAFVAMFTVLPSLIAFWERLRPGSSALLPDVPFPFLNTLAVFVRRFRYAVLAVFLVSTIAAAYFVPRVQLSTDPENMAPTGLPANETMKVIGEKYGQAGEVTVFFADEFEEVRRITEALEAAKTVGAVLSVTQALPENQSAKLPYLDRIHARLNRFEPPADRIEHTYSEAEIEELEIRLAKLKMGLIDLSLVASILYSDDAEVRVGRIRDLVNRIDRQLVPSSAERLRTLDELIYTEAQRTHSMITASTLSDGLGVDDLPDSLVGRVRGHDGNWMVISRAAQYPFEQPYLDAHVSELEAVRGRFTGLVPVWQRVLSRIIDDLPRLAGFTLAAVFIIVLVDMRSVRRALLALVPVAVSLVWTIGIVGALKLPFNVISLMSLPLIMGIGIDAGVHLIHRIHLEHDLDEALRHCGKAIILTSMTTAIGFGSLLVSIHRGLFSLGLTITIGIGASLLVTLVLVPALVCIFDDERPPDGDSGYEEDGPAVPVGEPTQEAPA